MRPTFMGFETASRGLQVNQKAMDIVGNNLTNIGVTGYTRQRVDVVSFATNTRTSRYAANSATYAGQGAVVYGVSQTRDKFLDKRFREEYSDVGYYGTTASVLGDIASVIDEISPQPMLTAIGGFEQAWTDLAKKATSESVGASNLLSSATEIVSVFKQFSQKLDNVWDQREYDTRIEINNINSILERVAYLNDEIAKEKFNTFDGNSANYKPLELLDQRNLLLDELSAYGNISYTEDENSVVTVKFGTQVVVDGGEYDKLQMVQHDNGNGYKSVSIFFNSTGENIDVQTGSLKAGLDMLNGRGIHSGQGNNENFSDGILYYKEKIDQFAVTLAEAFNNVIEIEMLDAAGNSFDPPQGYDPPRYKTLFSFENDSMMNAGTIKINDEWMNDSHYIINNLLDKIESDNTNTDEDDPQTGSGIDDNTYAAKAMNLFKESLDFGEYTGAIRDYIEFYSVTKLGNQLTYDETRYEAVAEIAENVMDQIQEVSGVSMDEEGVNMTMFKRAYDSVSRVFTTLDEMLDKLINGTGVVGR